MGTLHKIYRGDSQLHQKKKRERRRRRVVVPRLSPLYILSNWLSLWALCTELSLTSFVALYLTLTSSLLLLRLNLLCTSSLVMVYLKVSEFVCWVSPTGCSILTLRVGTQSLEQKKLQAPVTTRLLSLL